MQLQENKAAASIATRNNCNGGIFLMYQIIIFRNDHKVKFLKLNIFHVVDFYFILSFIVDAIKDKYHCTRTYNYYVVHVRLTENPKLELGIILRQFACVQNVVTT